MAPTSLPSIQPAGAAFAILGATGNAGGALLRVLLQSSDRRIHAYCRSKQKLLNQFPRLETDERVHIFEGSMNDIELLSNCLEHTAAVFLTVAVTENQPGCTIAQDTAASVVQALEKLKAQNQHLPKVIVLSSASTDHRLMTSVPALLRNVLYCAFSNIYQDLEKAEAFLRSQDAIPSITWIKPGALSNDLQKGHSIDTENAYSPISFLDLAAGMVEVAEDDTSRFHMKAVAVNATAKDVSFPWDAPLGLARGLIFHFMPWTYRFLG